MKVSMQCLGGVFFMSLLFSSSLQQDTGEFANYCCSIASCSILCSWGVKCHRFTLHISTATLWNAGLCRQQASLSGIYSVQRGHAFVWPLNTSLSQLFHWFYSCSSGSLYTLLISVCCVRLVAEDISVHQLARLVELLTSKECEDLLFALSHPEENIFQQLERLSAENNHLDLMPRSKRDTTSAEGWFT